MSSALSNRWRQSDHDERPEEHHIAFDPFNVDMMDSSGLKPSGDFSKNDIDPTLPSTLLWYYKDPGQDSRTSRVKLGQFAYANEDKPIMIPTNFFWGEGNNFENFRKKVRHLNLQIHQSYEPSFCVQTLLSLFLTMLWWISSSQTQLDNSKRTNSPTQTKKDIEYTHSKEHDWGNWVYPDQISCRTPKWDQTCHT